jgi:hypothetical protein
MNRIRAVMGSVGGGARGVATALVAAAIVLAATAVRAEFDVAAARGRLVLADEPAGALSLTAAKEKLTPEPQPIVVVGRIGGRGMDPFVKGKASFSLVEMPDGHASKPGHKADDCPFCKKRAASAPIAAVQFVGEDGAELPIDARALFGVKEGQDVVIRGSGRFDPKLGIPVIQLTGDGIHVRPAAK